MLPKIQPTTQASSRRFTSMAFERSDYAREPMYEVDENGLGNNTSRFRRASHPKSHLYAKGA